MTLTCPECGSNNVVDDDLYSQRQMVCEDCGSVVSEGAFTLSKCDESQGTDVPYHLSTAVAKRPCQNQIKGLQRVRALCRILKLPGYMESAAVSLFEQAYIHPNFLKASLHKKAVLGGCCVLSICRQHNRPITMGSIAYLVEADHALVGATYKELIGSLNIEPSSFGILDLLESYCHRYKLGPGQVAEELSESTQRLVERTSALVELAADTWLVTGRRPEPILMASVYVAWQSLNPMARLRCSLEKFRQIAKVPKTTVQMKTPLRRVAELRDVLCKLGRELPWLRGGLVEPATVARLVEDILKHRQSLLIRAMGAYEDALRRELSLAQESGPTQDITSMPEGTAPDLLTQTRTVAEGQPEEDHQPPNDAQAPPQAPVEVQGEDIDSVSELHGDRHAEENTPPAGPEALDRQLAAAHWGKRHLFVPPCAREAKKQRVDPPGPTVTGDEDISDSEIDSYIRSPQEIKDYLEIRERLGEVSD